MTDLWKTTKQSCQTEKLENGSQQTVGWFVGRREYFRSGCSNLKKEANQKQFYNLK